MKMFDTYDNLNEDYIPDNSTVVDDSVVTLDSTLPRKLYDVKNRFIGYEWSTTDRFSFKLSVNDAITIDDDAILYNYTGGAPDYYTEGTRVGQQAYNLVDRKSWTFVGRTHNTFMWIEDAVFTYSADGTNTVELRADMTERKTQLCIYNFRWELITEFISETGIPEVIVHITDDVAKLLPTGAYYAILKTVSDSSVELKNRYYFVIK